jgi:putative flippase GtrA
LSVILANITGILFNFKTYGKFVFKTSGNSRLYRFIAAYLFLTLTQITLLKYFAYLGIDSPYYAAGILTLPMAALSYLLLSQFVFRTQTNVEKLIDESSD